MSIFSVGGPAKLRQAASGYATQNFWLRNRKAKCWVIGIDRCRAPERRALSREGGRSRTTCGTNDGMIYERGTPLVQCRNLRFGYDR